MSQGDEREARLKAAKEAKAAFEARQVAREAARAADAELLTLEREVKEAEAIEKAELELGARGEHYDIVPTIYGIVIVKRPHPVIFRRFQDEGKATVESLTKLVDHARYYPDQSALDSLLDKQPAKLTECADAVCTLAGARAVGQAKK